MNPMEVVLEFLDRIKKRDADKLVELMTEDHLFVHSLGNSTKGRENMRAAWRGYYSFCPDNWFSHEDNFADGSSAAVFGAAGGMVAANGKLPPENK